MTTAAALHEILEQLKIQKVEDQDSFNSIKKDIAKKISSGKSSDQH